MKTLITQVAGIVEAPIDAVRDALFNDLLPDGTRRGTFSVEDVPGHTSTAEVADYDISLQGGWWYRGEWHLEPREDGTLVRHSVYNVATRARWGVGLANKFFIGFSDSTRKMFRTRLTTIAQSLDAPPPRECE